MSARTTPWVSSFCVTLLIVVLGCGGEDASHGSADANGSHGVEDPYGNENLSTESGSSDSITDSNEQSSPSMERTQARVMRPYEMLELTDDQEAAIRDLIEEHGQRLDELLVGQMELRRAPKSEEIDSQSEEIDKQIAEELKAIRVHVREVLTPEQIKQYREEIQAKNSNSSSDSTD